MSLMSPALADGFFTSSATISKTKYTKLKISYEKAELPIVQLTQSPWELADVSYSINILTAQTLIETRLNNMLF